MRKLSAAIFMMGVALLLANGTNFAQEKKEEPKVVMLKGTITCAKCDLGITKGCTTVIVVKDEKEKKDVVYYFDKGAHTKYHSDTCQASKPGSVEGTVADDGKKKTITVKKLTYE